MKRRESRGKILQILFQIDITKDNPQEVIARFLEEGEPDLGDISFIDTTVKGTTQHLKEIDEIVSKYLKGWTLSRLPNVDRAILRLATYEMIFTDGTSQGVIINEAVELAKTFGSNESAKYINGVLGALAKDY